MEVKLIEILGFAHVDVLFKPQDFSSVKIQRDSSSKSDLVTKPFFFRTVNLKNHTASTSRFEYFSGILMKLGIVEELPFLACFQ